MNANLTPRQLQRWFGRVALTLVVTFIVTQAFSYAAVQAWIQLFGRMNYTNLMLLNDVTIYLPCLILIPLLLCRLPRVEPGPAAALGGQEGFLALVFSLGTGYLFAYITAPIISLLEHLAGQSSYNVVSNVESALSPVSAAVAFVLVAPVAEEVIFRRLLLDRVRIFGDRATILIGGVAFGLFHGNLNQTFYAFALGAVFSAIILMTNRLRYTIAIHMFINGISVLTTFCETDLLKYLVMILIVFCVVFSIILFFIRRKRYTLESGPLPFSERQKARACFASPWTWVLLVGGLGFSTVSIFF